MPRKNNTIWNPLSKAFPNKGRNSDQAGRRPRCLRLRFTNPISGCTCLQLAAAFLLFTARRCLCFCFWYQNSNLLVENLFLKISPTFLGVWLEACLHVPNSLQGRRERRPNRWRNGQFLSWRGKHLRAEIRSPSLSLSQFCLNSRC